ncbi:hypothetical protein BGW36DRAFT_145775 [Talaromyces proteolyticus]|uniref:Zn(2)-C6 fungal-type domain-containing protein n=1 Tax=Talaromyces proteolyticus TaxID=1131652 RepID=A0AAD4KSL3_9EURO|nr:uncharacterized protein BGW36DRAFT_145775 [Talaromyces proteolyticus]KAH8698432.1 hypothetical protein BGW36DRAFT_145775 [Talaromyces proteolyticus]
MRRDNGAGAVVSSRSRVFRPCLTCRRRKISCDKAKPKCKRCHQTGYQCEGYGEERSFVYVVPTKISTTRTSDGSTDEGNTKKITLKSSRQVPLQSLTPSIHSVSANRIQVLSYFLDSYLPGRPAHPREDQTALTWIRSWPLSLGKWNFLDMSLSALSLAYIGDMHQNQTLLHQGERCYDEALMRMRARLSQNSIDEGVLAACMSMSIYELFHTTGNSPQGWMFHVKGACHLLRLRGPPSENSPLDMNLYRRIRAAALWDSYGSGKPTFLAGLEWCGLSDMPYDRLLDILIRLPSLLAKADQIESTSKDVDAIRAAQELLGKCHALRDELIFWYAGFQSEESGPLFYLELEERHPYLDPDSDLQDVFPESVTFQNAYIAQILLLYWYGEVVVHSIMSHMHRFTQKNTQNVDNTATATPPEQQVTGDVIRDVDTVGEHFASKICQAMAGCGRNCLQGYGFQIALVPLWAAQQFFFQRSPRKYKWCQTVLVNFSTKGFVLAQSLGRLALRQYPGRKIEESLPADEVD